MAVFFKVLQTSSLIWSTRSLVPLQTPAFTFRFRRQMTTQPGLRRSSCGGIPDGSCLLKTAVGRSVPKASSFSELLSMLLKRVGGPGSISRI